MSSDHDSNQNKSSTLVKPENVNNSESISKSCSKSAIESNINSSSDSNSSLNSNVSSITIQKAQKSILTICAHNDDQIIGAGGTIRKYVNDGINAYTCIFSFGEQSHPHLRPEIVANMREKESLKGARILGDEIEYLGLKEGNFEKEVDMKKFKSIIKRIKPQKIFLHSPNDPHPDHHSVFKITIIALKELNYKGDIYTFDVWNVFTFTSRPHPKLIVDISDTYKIKSKSLHVHKSQIGSILLLGGTMFIKALLNGWNNHCRFAEVFHKLDLNDIKVEKIDAGLDGKPIKTSKKKIKKKSHKK